MKCDLLSLFICLDYTLIKSFSDVFERKINPRWRILDDRHLQNTESCKTLGSKLRLPNQQGCFNQSAGLWYRKQK